MKKRIFSIMLLITATVLLVACKKEQPLRIWVGSESKEFYEEKMEEYVAKYKEKHGEDFPFKISVEGVDTGSAAGTFLDDTEAGADILTVAHDNLGRLTSGSSSIAPVQSEALLAQIEADNPEIFLDVIKSTVDGQTYTFGVPYISQSLVLYYNKKYITEEQVKTWEGILEAAKTSKKQALSVTGTDGYNNSFLLLAQNAETGESSLELYEGGNIEANKATGDDILSVLKWGQRFFNDPNGPKRPTDSGWQVEMQEEVSISTISGAWNYNAASAALGSNLGIAALPTFTLTEADVTGDIAAGTVMQSGTFADAKVFVMKKGSEKAEYLEDILLYLTSKEMQEESFVAVDNLPAYKNANTEFESMADNELAKKQVEMFDKGIPQPFGHDRRFNFYYYSNGGPELILEILENPNNNLTTHAQIKAQMEIVEKIWKTGSKE